MSDTSPIIQNFLSAQFLLALLLSIAIIPILRRAAIIFGLVDHPGGRKKHQQSTPLVGGPAIIIATSISLLIWGMPTEFEGSLYAAGGLFLIGLIDDKFDISAKLRLTLQMSLVVTALWWDGIWLSQLVLTDSLTLDLGVFSYPITVLAVLGIMNAINMLDGLDGLSSGVVLIILGFLIGISTVAEQSAVTLVGVCVFGTVLGFWAYNYRFAWREKASVFMGDSGTTVLGFILPVLAIKLSMSSSSYAPNSLLLWLFAIPVWDICAVIIKRLRDGKSPMQAGRDHIHHVLMDAGLSVRQCLHLIYLLTIATISFGVSAKYFGLTQIEAFGAFFLFMTVYLGRVGSLSNRRKDNIYDFQSMGDRRVEPVLAESKAVVDIQKRSNTLY